MRMNGLRVQQRMTDVHTYEWKEKRPCSQWVNEMERDAEILGVTNWRHVGRYSGVEGHGSHRPVAQGSK